jgi:hypothetical protein
MARLPPEVIARLPPEVMARLPPEVIARLPPEVIAFTSLLVLLDPNTRLGKTHINSPYRQF